MQAALAWIHAVIANPLFFLMAKTIGAGAVLKFLLSTKIGPKEAIDYLPSKFQPFVAHVIALAVYGGYGLMTGSYVGPTGETNFLTDVVTSLCTGGSAVWIHNVLVVLLPILSQVQAILPAGPAPVLVSVVPLPGEQEAQRQAPAVAPAAAPSPALQAALARQAGQAGSQS